jgi:hypothetical protein
MTEIQNPKQLAFDLICNLVLVVCYFRFIRIQALNIEIPSCLRMIYAIARLNILGMLSI